MSVFRLVVVGLVASSLSLLVCGDRATAETPPGLARFNAAATRFKELQNAARARNTMPRISEPEVADLVQVLSDADGLFGTAKYNKDDLSVVKDACAPVERIVAAYGLHAGVDVAGGSDIIAREMLNFVKFQDEMAPLTGLQLRCTAKIVQLTRDVVSSLRPGEGGINREMLAVAGETVMHTFLARLALMDDGTVRPENQIRMLSSLAETASSLSDLTTRAQRKSILERAENVSVGEELKPYLNRIIAAMSRTDCDDLCLR